MKKLFRWILVNKTSCSGILALIISFIDAIFHISDQLNLPNGWYYTIIACLFVLISYSIKGKGFQPVTFIEDVLKEKKEEMTEEKKESNSEDDNKDNLIRETEDKNSS